MGDILKEIIQEIIMSNNLKNPGEQFFHNTGIPMT